MSQSSSRRKLHLFQLICQLIWTVLQNTLVDSRPVSVSGFMPNDRCTVLISGGPRARASNQRSVHSVHLKDCEQGSLVWSNPGGSLLATFDLPFDQFDNPAKKSFQLCLNFPELGGPKVTVQKMTNSKLGEVLSVPSSSTMSPALQCIPVQSADKIQLFLKAKDNGGHSELSTFGFYYALEEVLEEPNCGQCNERQVLDAFCSANFVFKGKLMRQLSEGDALEFSVETPLIRRPPLLTNIVSSRNIDQQLTGNDRTFNTTILFSKCPQGSIQGPIFHPKFLVVANAQLGFARLLCALELDSFERIASANSATAPCDLSLSRSR